MGPGMLCFGEFCQYVDRDAPVLRKKLTLKALRRQVIEVFNSNFAERD